MKKTILTGLAIVLCLSLAFQSIAATDKAKSDAEALHDLGLFQGVGMNADGTINYDLDRQLTREEAITLLVRFTGGEADTLSGTWEMPFTDVSSWAKPYVGYAWQHGLTNGTSAVTFGGSDAISASQFLSFVLRALGYQSGTDFSWETAWEKTDALSITNGEFKDNNAVFTRGDAATVLYNALFTEAQSPVATPTPMVSGAASNADDQENFVKPYLLDLDYSNLTEETANIFGGCYEDAFGHIVVTLTEDTPTNRVRVCAELGLDEGKVVFQSAQYARAYLLQLYEDISAAMSSGELPFVTGCGVYDGMNRVRVGVFSASDSDIAKLQSFDTIGGAIMIEQMSQFAFYE